MAKIRDVKLETVCGITSRLPVNDRIEVAFAGKSNVGKSSLINSLVNRKGIARTSGQPGKTQTINYYHVNAGTPDSDTRLAEPFAPDAYLVDLPGYGFANVSVVGEDDRELSEDIKDASDGLSARRYPPQAVGQ